MKKLFLLFLWVLWVSNAKAQSAVQVNPNTRYQEIEGWGGSLCWWANIAGGWSDAKVNEICTWLSNPNELNMNIFRFNIGGGDHPSHTHMRSDGGNMPGYKASATAPYDWSQDANQRKVLLKLKALRSDAIFEAFSNSPPYWMTKSGCAAGNTDGSDNLSDDKYDDFASYLTEVTRYYRNTHGITFRTLTPFNEPFSTWWKANGGQEGCQFSQANQQKMIRELYNSLSRKSMLGYCSISAMDANSLDEAYRGVNGYIAAGDIMSKITQINAHSYAGSNRSGLAGQARGQSKRLWQSETGPLYVNESGFAGHLYMAQRLIDDLRNMKSVAWLDWQLMANNDPNWGLIPGDYSKQTYWKDKSYYVRMQCSKFIKKGYTIIHSGDWRTVAALNPAKTELVLVVCNRNTTSTNFNLDLTLFNTVGSATVYRTTTSENCSKLASITFSGKQASYSAPAQSITTLVIPVSTHTFSKPANGTYKIFAKHSGKALEIGGYSTTDGAQVSQWSDNGGANQQWVLQAVGSNYSIKNKYSGKVMDVSGSSTDDGAAVTQYSYWGGKNQLWEVTNLGNGSFSIINLNSGKSLDIASNSTADGAKVTQYPYWAGNNQQFTLQYLSSSTLEADEQEVVEDSFWSLSPNPVVDKIVIRGAFSPEKGTTLQLYTSSGVLVHSQSLTDSSSTIDLSGMIPGIYYARITNSQKTVTMKVIKQ